MKERGSYFSPECLGGGRDSADHTEELIGILGKERESRGSVSVYCLVTQSGQHHCRWGQWGGSRPKKKNPI